MVGHSLTKVVSRVLNVRELTLRQLGNSNTRPRGLVREVFLKHSIHLGEVVHGRQEDCGLCRTQLAFNEALYRAAILTIGCQFV